jgi:hypothetical protein
MTINRNLSLLTPNVSASGAVNNAGLTNSSVTIGSTAVSLGATVTTFAGLTSVTSTTFVGALTGNASTATSAGSVTNTLTIGTGLSGTSFNGSAAVTIAIDSTVATLTGTQTLTNKSLTSPIVTGTLTAGGGVGTNGQVLQSTGTGVQWATSAGGSGGITTGKSIAMAIVFGG